MDLPAGDWFISQYIKPERFTLVMAVYERDGELHTVQGLLNWDGKNWRVGLSDDLYPGDVTHWQYLHCPPIHKESGHKYLPVHPYDRGIAAFNRQAKWTECPYTEPGQIYEYNAWQAGRTYAQKQAVGNV